MKITDVRAALVGSTPILRILTDEGVDGFAPIEWSKWYVLPTVPIFREQLIGLNPLDVEAASVRIRRLASHKPWGSVASAIEIALWDLTGKATNLPIYRLLGGKTRERIRVYNGGVRNEMVDDFSTQAFAAHAHEISSTSEGFTLVKVGVAFHGFMSQFHTDFSYGEIHRGPRHPNRGFLRQEGLDAILAAVEGMKEALPEGVALALDVGPGLLMADAITLARQLEPYRLAWIEDVLTGDYTPWIAVDQYRELTRSTSTPTHTGEQIYSRHNFLELLTTQAVRVIGPDPCDVGGLAELKWVAELADAYGIGVAPHGVQDGVLGLAALAQVCATLPQNFIAFEYPVGLEAWWYDAVGGIPSAVDGFVRPSDSPGLGLELDRDFLSLQLTDKDKGFFSWT